MRKLFFTMMIVLLSSLSKAQEKPGILELHQDIHTFLNQYFPNDKVANYDLDRENGNIVAFDLYLESGTEVIFSRYGSWKEVDMKEKGSVPSGIIPNNISIYVANHYKNASITEIEKDDDGYDFKLSNGLEFSVSQKGVIRKDM